MLRASWPAPGFKGLRLTAGRRPTWVCGAYVTPMLALVGPIFMTPNTHTEEVQDEKIKAQKILQKKQPQKTNLDSAQNQNSKPNTKTHSTGDSSSRRKKTNPDSAKHSANPVWEGVLCGKGVRAWPGMWDCGRLTD